MDRNASLFYQSALKLHLPITFISELHALKVRFGKKYYYFSRSINPLNEGASVVIANNKYFANQLLKSSGFSVPNAITFDVTTWKNNALSTLIAPLKFPLVIKPWQDSGRGNGVFCNIKNLNALSQHLEDFFSEWPQVHIEEFHGSLREFRVTILKQRVVGVLERTSAKVIGDGVHSIEALIEQSNEIRIPLSETLTTSPLSYDKEYQMCLEEQGYSLESVPKKGKTVKLCYTANTGRGGDTFSYGNRIHPENATTLCEAAECLGLNYVGFDVLCEDIQTPFADKPWYILEANHHADTTLHEIPVDGNSVKLTRKILMQLIKRHPISYLYHICMNSSISIYIKSSLILLSFVIFLLFFSQ